MFNGLDTGVSCLSVSRVLFAFWPHPRPLSNVERGDKRDIRTWHIIPLAMLERGEEGWGLECTEQRRNYFICDTTNPDNESSTIISPRGKTVKQSHRIATDKYTKRGAITPTLEKGLLYNFIKVYCDSCGIWYIKVLEAFSVYTLLLAVKLLPGTGFPDLQITSFFSLIIQMKTSQG